MSILLEGMPMIPDRELLNEVVEKAFEGYLPERDEIYIRHTIYDTDLPFYIIVVFHVDDLGEPVYQTCLNSVGKVVESFITDEIVQHTENIAQYVLARLDENDEFQPDDEEDMDEIGELEFDDVFGIDPEYDSADMILEGFDINEDISGNPSVGFEFENQDYIIYESD